MSSISVDSDVDRPEEEEEERTYQQKPQVCWYYDFPLYLVSVINGLSVPVNTKTYHVVNSTLYKIYATFLVIFVIVLAVWCMLGKAKYSFKCFAFTVNMNDIIFEVSLTMMHCIGIINMVYRGPYYLSEITKKFKAVDKRLSQTVGLKKNVPSYHSFIRFIAFHIFFGILCCSSYLVWTRTFGHKVSMFYSFRFYSHYAFLVIVLQIIMYADNVGSRFAAVNERLVDSFLHWSDSFHYYKKKKLLKEFSSSGVNENVKHLTIKELTVVYELLCDIIDILSSFYGLLMFLIVPNVVIGGAMLLNRIFLFVTNLIPFSCKITPSNSHHVVCIYVEYAFAIMTICICLSKSCTHCRAEGHKTATVAYRLLNLVPSQSSSSSDWQMKDELKHLALQVQIRNPALSALGIFSMTYATMYHAIGSVASYLIILIQINLTRLELTTIADKVKTPF